MTEYGIYNQNTQSYKQMKLNDIIWSRITSNDISLNQLQCMILSHSLSVQKNMKQTPKMGKKRIEQ